MAVWVGCIKYSCILKNLRLNLNSFIGADPKGANNADLQHCQEYNFCIQKFIHNYVYQQSGDFVM